MVNGTVRLDAAIIALPSRAGRCALDVQIVSASGAVLAVRLLALSSIPLRR